jgi:hypothetical protein
MVFPGATIDTVTIVGRKRPAPPGHQVSVTLRGRRTLQAHAVPQAALASDPRATFNLHLTPARRCVLERLSGCPRLGEYFEVHEGIHSGNLRAELFVDALLDPSCRPLLFGRDEIGPFRLSWHGRYVRLSAIPVHKSSQRYANVGRAGWHEREKVLVRRTGDRVIAAVDRECRYASNNFFLVFPKQACPLDLDGLCALLNSRLLTWYFRTIEPRRGRAFAELKIKHLITFPLPRQLLAAGGCDALNSCGQKSAADEDLDELVCRHFDISPDELD